VPFNGHGHYMVHMWPVNGCTFYHFCKVQWLLLRPLRSLQSTYNFRRLYFPSTWVENSAGKI